MLEIHHSGWEPSNFYVQLYVYINCRQYWPDGIVWAATDHQAITILQACDAPLMTVQCPHKFTCWCVPHLWHNTIIFMTWNLFSHPYTKEISDPWQILLQRSSIRLLLTDNRVPTSSSSMVVVHRNWWWRSSVLLPSAMGMEVAVESDPRLAGPGTVRAWEETGIAGGISQCLSSFPGLLDLCAVPLLKCVHGVSGEGSPLSPVMSVGLKLLGGNFCMAYAGLYAVFESIERSVLFLLPRSELPKHQLLQ